MSHAERLHHRLLAALLLVPGSGACSGSPRPADATTPVPTPSPAKAAPTDPPRPSTGGSETGGGEPAPQEEPVAKTTMDPRYLDPPRPEIPKRPRPTCPSGEWCGVVKPPGTGPDAVLGCPPRVDGSVKSIDPGKPDGPGGSQTTLDVAATNARRSAGVGDACCYHWVNPCPGGRALRDGETVVQAGFVPVEARCAGERPHHPEAAAAWLRDAGFEYASVASFARTALELMAVGAPAELIHDCHVAALDELRHAALCSEIAWSLGAEQVVPRVVPVVAPREASLVRVALDTFIEGCVGETLAALVASTAAAECSEAELRAALATIAEDEERHAALAWRTIRWAVAVGGSEVAAALREAATRERPELGAVVPSAEPEDAALRRCGRLDARTQEQVRRRVWRDVIDPLLRVIVEPATSRPCASPPRRVGAEVLA